MKQEIRPQAKQPPHQQPKTAPAPPARQENLYADPAPYPQACAAAKQPLYARAMLANIGGCASEMSAVALYFYGSTLLHHGQWARVGECLHGVSVVEMRHLGLFAQAALSLGADPRLWSATPGGMRYWSPQCIPYPRDAARLLRAAIEAEEKTVARYRRQARVIQDSAIVALLQRVILDEELHIRLFEKLLGEVSDS